MAIDIRPKRAKHSFQGCTGQMNMFSSGDLDTVKKEAAVRTLSKVKTHNKGHCQPVGHLT